MLKGVIHHILLVLVTIISLMLLYSAMLKLVSFPGMEESFLLWGYSKIFMYVVGVVELALSILVFVKATRRIGLTGLILLMIGALFTHISNNEFEQIYTALFLLIVATCSFVLIFLKESSSQD